MEYKTKMMTEDTRTQEELSKENKKMDQLYSALSSFAEVATDRSSKFNPNRG